MKYSFLVINKNGESTLVRCLESINRVKPQHSEVILLDDSSVDSSVFLSSKLVDKIVINKKSIGIGRSRNKGIRESRGEYVVIIDSDIEITQINFDSIEKHFNNTKLVAISGYYASKSNSTDWNTALDIRRKYVFGKDDLERISTISDYTTFSGGFCILRRSVVKNLKFREENGFSGEDLIFQIQLLNKGFNTLYLPTFKGIHHHKRSGKSIYKKAISEANGAYWMAIECKSLDLSIPYYEYAINFPFFLILALISPNFFVSIALLLIEFLPYLAIIIRQKFSRASVKLLLLAAFVYLIRIPLIFQWVFRKGYTLKSKLSLVYFAIFSDFSAKMRFIKYSL